MAVATGALIAMGVGAGMSAGSAAYQAHKAGQAAKAQEQSAHQALDFSRNIYNDQMRMVNPYVQMGGDALSRLYSEHYGTPYAGTPSSGQPSQPSAPPGGGGQAPALGGPDGRWMGMNLAQLGQQRMGAGQPTLGAGQPTMGGGAPMMLRAPTGETMAVHDPQEAQRLIGLGAKEVR